MECVEDCPVVWFLVLEYPKAVVKANTDTANTSAKYGGWSAEMMRSPPPTTTAAPQKKRNMMQFRIRRKCPKFSGAFCQFDWNDSENSNEHLYLIDTVLMSSHWLNIN